MILKIIFIIFYKFQFDTMKFKVYKKSKLMSFEIFIIN